MDMPLVPSSASPGDARRMKARGRPLYSPLPTISLYSLMPVALVRTQPVPGAIRWLRLVMTPFRHKNAWLVFNEVVDVPTIQANSLMAAA